MQVHVVDDARALAQARLRAVADLGLDLRAARNVVASGNPKDHKAQAQASAAVAEVERRIAEAQRDVAARAARAGNDEQCLAQVREWLHRLPAVRQLEPTRRPKVSANAVNVASLYREFSHDHTPPDVAALFGQMAQIWNDRKNRRK